MTSEKIIDRLQSGQILKFTKDDGKVVIVGYKNNKYNKKFKKHISTSYSHFKIMLDATINTGGVTVEEVKIK